MAPYDEEQKHLDGEIAEEFEKLVAPQAAPRKFEIIYMNVIIFSYSHMAAIYGLYLCFTSANWKTTLMDYILLIASVIGITAGAHRLDSQGVQADPHNATRGFFYSHVGWLLVRKNPEEKKREKYIDMSDIYNNPVLKFQTKYAVPVIGLACFVIPTAVPMFCWGESFNNAWNINLLRYVLNLHVAFLVNSVAHLWGTKPYDSSIMPSENKVVSIVSVGEGFHYYHHVFPWDYRAAELENNKFNFTTKFIDFFAWIGWAYDLKSVSNEMLETRCKRTGDGTSKWAESSDGVNGVLNKTH